MDGSAGAVGRIMAPLLGVPPSRRDAFGALGEAFQLTNFIRDVREDWALDRVYLPGLGRGCAGAPAGRPPAPGAGEVGRAAQAVPRDGARGGGACTPRARPGIAGPRLRARLDRRVHVSRRASRAAGRGSWWPMTRPRNRRGAERTSLDGDRADVIVCGARFAGLAVARELAAPAPTCWSWTATRSASARPRPARARRRGWRPWASRRRPPGAARHGFTTPRGAVRYGCRGAGRRSTTASCASCCGSSAAMRALRPPSCAARRGDTVHTDRGDVARRCSSTPPAGGACSAPRTSSRPRRR